jgi:predicted  nucleic acid-binding Zn-ribbon protein
MNANQRGCVHCVWDIYREDIEDWQHLRQKARDALKAKKKRIPVWLGGKTAKLEESDPLADIDPGLRAFMELEKVLKERREERRHHTA